MTKINISTITNPHPPTIIDENIIVDVNNHWSLIIRLDDWYHWLNFIYLFCFFYKIPVVKLKHFYLFIIIVLLTEKLFLNIFLFIFTIVQYFYDNLNEVSDDITVGDLTHFCKRLLTTMSWVISTTSTISSASPINFYSCHIVINYRHWFKYLFVFPHYIANK